MLAASPPAHARQSACTLSVRAPSLGLMLHTLRQGRIPHMPLTATHGAQRHTQHTQGACINGHNVLCVPAAVTAASFRCVLHVMLQASCCPAVACLRCYHHHPPWSPSSPLVSSGASGLPSGSAPSSSSPNPSSSVLMISTMFCGQGAGREGILPHESAVDARQAKAHQVLYAWPPEANQPDQSNHHHMPVLPPWTLTEHRFLGGARKTWAQPHCCHVLNR